MKGRKKHRAQGAEHRAQGAGHRAQRKKRRAQGTVTGRASHARQCIMYYRRCENNWQLSMNN